MAVQSQMLPGYRFVDIYRATEEAVQNIFNLQTVFSQQHEPLEALLHRSPYGDRTAARAAMRSFETGHGEDASFSVDTFWIRPSGKGQGGAVFRVRFIDFQEQCELSIAGPDAKAQMDAIIDAANKHSIYRNKAITLAYEAGKRDEYGDVEKPEKLSVGFSQLPPVTEDEIILSQRHLRLLERNMIDLDLRRDVLRENGVLPRRGILLYGPPGTGKTYACRYMAHRMQATTRIFLTGTALSNVTAVFSLARLLQPSVVFIEDADLMFASRDINLYSTSLGEFMDQLDGLRANEEVSLVMTTNALERLEAALKDRPGRISQCIYMGEPGPDLRERILRQLLSDRDVNEETLSRLVDLSDGTTHAFLKEWVSRAVQIACEGLEPGQAVALDAACFEVAMEEMQSDRDGSAGRIIGFRTAQN